MNRREFLRLAAAAGISTLSTPALAGWGDWRDELVGKDRSLWIRRAATGEEVRANYLAAGAWRHDDYLALCRIFRDVRENAVITIDIPLFDVLSGMQAWLAHYGYRQPILLLSGHRTMRTNSRTEGASMTSAHIDGRAGDILIPGISTETTGLMAAKFGVGGVGFYPNRNFIHVDTKRVRYWVDAKRRPA